MFSLDCRTLEMAALVNNHLPCMATFAATSSASEVTPFPPTISAPSGKSLGKSGAKSSGKSDGKSGGKSLGKSGGKARGKSAGSEAKKVKY